MSVFFDEYATEQEAVEAVKFLMANGYSAYRQGRKVYIDDGGVDDGYGEEVYGYDDY